MLDIMDWQEFYEKMPQKVVENIPEVVEADFTLPTEVSRGGFEIILIATVGSKVSMKKLSRLVNEYAELLAGSVYTGKILTRDGDEVDYEGRLTPKITIRLLHIPNAVSRIISAEDVHSKDTATTP